MKYFRIALSTLAISLTLLIATPSLAKWPETRSGTGTFVSGTGKGDNNSCPPANLPLVALAYAYKPGIIGRAVYGQTTQDKPTLWFYSPYSLGQTKLTATLALRIPGQKNDEKVVPKIPLPSQPGFISVSIPKQLDQNKIYVWEFTVNCPNPPKLLSGMIERVRMPDDLTKKLAQAQQDYGKQAKAYEESGIWYDTVNSLIENRRAKNNLSDLQDFFLTAWKGVLNPVQEDQVKKILTQPISPSSSRVVLPTL
jgi:Domain of Unknown Function (DUF928)